MIIDVYADLVCPWCLIGLKRMEKALQMEPELRVERRWRPFQLRPEMPPRGRDWPSFAEEKFGGLERAQAAFAQVTQLGEEEGIDFRFGRVASAPNTVDAHRLILLARDHGREWEMAQALFRAYFSEGRDLNRLEHLTETAAEAGLEEAVVRPYLQGDEGREAVQEGQRAAHAIGVSGVPFYAIGRQGGNRYAVSGAQPPEVFLRVFDELAAAKA